MQLLQSLARVTSSPQETGPTSPQSRATPERKAIQSPSGIVDLQPELTTDKSGDGKSVWSTLDAVITLETVKLHLYDRFATTEDTLKDHGITRFALNSSTLRAKTLSDGATEAELILKSFTMSNTRPGNSKFREIIPAAQHTRNQVMILYSASGGTDPSSMAVLTVDSPQVIFAVEPVIGLLEFFTSAFDQGDESDQDHPEANTEDSTVSTSTSKFNVRLDLHDLSVSILEDDTSLDSRAIRLAIKTISLSYQVGRCYLEFANKTNQVTGNTCIECRTTRHVSNSHGERRGNCTLPRRHRFHILVGQPELGCTSKDKYRAQFTTGGIQSLVSRHKPDNHHRLQGN